MLLLCVFLGYEMANRLQRNTRSSQKIRSGLLGNAGGLEFISTKSRMRKLGSAGSRICALEIHEVLTRGSLPGCSATIP